MPFNVGESINYVSEKFINAPIVRGIMKNPFYTAVMIVMIIVLIILYVFRNVDFEGEDESLSKLVFRGSIYMLIIITAIQFLNNQIWLEDKKSSVSNEGVKNVFGGVEKFGTGKVVPSSYGNGALGSSAFSNASNIQQSGAGVVNFNIIPSEVSSDLPSLIAPTAK